MWCAVVASWWDHDYSTAMITVLQYRPEHFVGVRGFSDAAEVSFLGGALFGGAGVGGAKVGVFIERYLDVLYLAYVKRRLPAPSLDHEWHKSMKASSANVSQEVDTSVHLPMFRQGLQLRGLEAVVDGIGLRCC